ncbi:Rv3235 family protein [Nocardia brevicatena]|uniref:Rv3235 family protein n=1 Tax=Nocardia brevicatena TaxID=37327 RepID=UPI0012F78A46|nr:Rv3235 family protein [Nocardia brevicatena]
MTPATSATGISAAEKAQRSGCESVVRTSGSDASSDGRFASDPAATACPAGIPRDRRRPRTGAVPDRGVPEGVRQVLRAGHTAAVADAREYSWHVLRIVLEVLDRKRPVAQLARFASPAVQAAVSTLVSGDHLRHRELGTAVLARVHAIGIDDLAAEVCGTYQRGSRHFAIAARITRTRTSGWQLTALRV